MANSGTHNGTPPPPPLVASSSGLVPKLSEGRVRVGFVDEPDVAREIKLQRREGLRQRVCRPRPDSFSHAPQRTRLRSLQLQARTCLSDETFDRRLRADVLSRRRRLRAGQGATITHREEGAALDRGRQVYR